MMRSQLRRPLVFEAQIGFDCPYSTKFPSFCKVKRKLPLSETKESPILSPSPGFNTLPFAGRFGVAGTSVLVDQYGCPAAYITRLPSLCITNDGFGPWPAVLDA